MQDPNKLRPLPRFRVPAGLDALLEELIRAVLHSQPDNLELFIADHLQKLITLQQAAASSSQASPTDIIKHIVEQEPHSRVTTSESSKAVVISQQDEDEEDVSGEPEESADADGNSDNADQRSLHCVEATAVRTLAASTGTVAILGTTAKCNETLDYRRSVHSEQAYMLDYSYESTAAQKEEEELSEKQLRDIEVATPSDTTESTNIVTTAIIEAPPSTADDIEKAKEPAAEVSAQPVLEAESRFPKEVHANSVSLDDVPTRVDNEEPCEGNRTSENSEKESSSSEVISVVKEVAEPLLVRYSRTSFDIATRPNRLSLGQQSVESDQNTVEISSADDVKNESTADMTSPESTKGSLEESLVKSVGSKTNPKEISNTSLNTLGNDSEEDGSDLEVDLPRRAESMMKRFDTISSNGESSYRMEETNYPSVTEEPELEEYVAQIEFSLGPTQEEVFDNGLHNRYVESVRETATCEVDKICEQAVEKTTDILLAKAVAEEAKEAEDVNNVSESSALSAIDSVVAEKGSDFDSLSYLDEQSDSRSVSVLGDDTKSCRSEIVHEEPAREDAQKRLQEVELSPTLAAEDTSVSSQDISGAVIMQEDRSLIDNDKTLMESMSEDLPNPPNLEDLPPLPECLDQYDITEEELKAVQLPENMTRPVSEDKSAEAAASKIQAGVRGYLTRKQIKSLKNERTAEIGTLELEKADSFDVECSKNFSKSKRLSLDSKLVDIENIRKLPKLKSTLSECIEEEGETTTTELDKAAAKIQNTYRNYRARKSICLGDPNANRTTLNGAPLKMNNLVSNAFQKYGDVQTKHVENEDNKFTEIVKPKLLEGDQLQPLIEGGEQRGSNTAYDEDPLKQAAVKIQATYRGFKARKSLQISASAATKIQAHFRGYKVRKNFKRCSSLNDLGTNDSTSSSCSNLSSSKQQDLEKHVTKIQAGVRGYLVRKRHSLANSAATKIQLNYRKYKSKKAHQPQPFNQ